MYSFWEGFFLCWWDHLPWQHHQFSIYYERKCWHIRRQDHLTDEREKFKKRKIFSSKLSSRFCFFLHFFHFFFFSHFPCILNNFFYGRFTVIRIYCSFVVSSEIFLLVLKCWKSIENHKKYIITFFPHFMW